MTGYLFDLDVYKRRIEMSIAPFLKEASAQAQRRGVPAYVGANGIGLGVWLLCDEQFKAQLDVYLQILQSQSFPHISDVNIGFLRNQPELAASAPKSILDRDNHEVWQ